MESFLELEKARYSCRKFAPKMIEDKILNQILETGRVSPTAVIRFWGQEGFRLRQLIISPKGYWSSEIKMLLKN